MKSNINKTTAKYLSRKIPNVSTKRGKRLVSEYKSWQCCWIQDKHQQPKCCFWHKRRSCRWLLEGKLLGTIPEEGFPILPTNSGMLTLDIAGLLWKLIGWIHVTVVGGSNSIRYVFLLHIFKWRIFSPFLLSFITLEAGWSSFVLTRRARD